MPVPSNDVRLINSVFISKRSMMCGIPYDYTAPVHEYVAYAAYADNSSETSGTYEEENLNTWNALLELLTMPGSSPAIQQCFQDWEVCIVALSCHSRWAVGICPWYLSMECKQGSDCRDDQIERCESTSASMQAWKTGERLVFARFTTYIVHYVTRVWYGDCGKECGSEARVTEALSGLDKVRTGSKRTQDGTTVLL